MGRFFGTLLFGVLAVSSVALGYLIGWISKSGTFEQSILASLLIGCFVWVALGYYFRERIAGRISLVLWYSFEHSGIAGLGAALCEVGGAILYIFLHSPLTLPENIPLFAGYFWPLVVGASILYWAVVIEGPTYTWRCFLVHFGESLFAKIKPPHC